MFSYAHLGWLPSAPENFSEAIKAIRADGGDSSDAIRALVAHGLSANQLHRIAKLVNEGRAPQLAAFRLGILSSATTDFLMPALTGTGPRYGMALTCIATAYGQYMQEALDPNSAFHAAGCDAVLVALDVHALSLASTPGDEDQAAAAVRDALKQVEMLANAVAATGAMPIVQNLASPPETYLGHYDAVLAGSVRSQISAFNHELALQCRTRNFILLDVCHLASSAGLECWNDPVAWNLAKQPVGHDLIALYADHVCRILAAMSGKSRKALVLDLDNTVWAGVIGDDGMSGINIAQGDATGEAHLALQRYALAMRERGVVLAVSSKNTDEIARQVFREHPDMLLREEHIAVFQANWNDKATNLKAIAEALNIGLDALVFVDDNPAERALVRQRLPQVAVPELPTDPAHYVRTVAAAGYFEAAGFSDEDRKRAQYYTDNARRVALQTGTGSIDDYLQSLHMAITLSAFDETGRARIAQLINKSNQFNLTTRRYTEADIDAMMRDPTVFTVQIRLADIFGDNGMISVIICRQQGADWEIDSWLMSCRVLGRRVEEVALAELVRAAKQRGVNRLIGLYCPTNRNGIVADHYRKLGFVDDGVAADGSERSIYAVARGFDDSLLDIFASVSTDGLKI